MAEGCLDAVAFGYEPLERADGDGGVDVPAAAAISAGG